MTPINIIMNLVFLKETNQPNTTNRNANTMRVLTAYNMLLGKYAFDE